MGKRVGRIHCVIPDVQCREDVDFTHLKHVGNYIADKQPDVVICIGDFADMPSLNSHNEPGHLDVEGQRYVSDIKSAKKAMNYLLTPIRRVKNYEPRMVMTLGNHEYRITREAEKNPKLIGKISIDDLGYKEVGWEVIPFLKIIKIDGIEYVHYFTSGVKGNPVSSAASILRERHCSGVMGHVQYTDLAFHKKSGHIGIMAGTCYTHDEKYLGYQGNQVRRQIIFLHEVQNGTADPMFVSLDYLKKNYS